MPALAIKKIQNIKPLTILQRIANKDQADVKDCTDTYGNFIWALARKFTNSMEEADAAATEIFIDIGRHVERADQPQSAETLLVALIAQRRLIKHLQ